MFFDDFKTLSRAASRAAALKDNVVHNSIASTAKDSIFQFPCLASDTIPLNMASATVRLLDINYASFVQIVLSQVANVDISIDRTPSQFLKRIHQNMRLESVSSDEERLLKEKFYDGKLVIAVNENRNLAVLFEGGKLANGTKLYAANLEACREWLSDYDFAPFMEADEPLTNADIVNGLLQNSKNKASRSEMELRQKIANGGRAPSLTDYNAKKLNDVQPYALQVRLTTINDEQEFVGYWDIVVGIKAYLHVIKSDEIVYNIRKTIAGQSAVFNMIRWTTGEISFFKDLILHLDDIKDDARARSNGATAWFPTLRRLKERKFSFKNFKVNNIVPNSTLMISSYEVEVLETKFGILIKDANIARRLVDGLFLMAFVILDEGTQTMDIMYDHSKQFETYALETVQREVSLSSNKLASEIGRMIGTQR